LFDTHLKQRLDRSLDFRLGRISGNPEHHLVFSIGANGRLLGKMRRPQNLKRAFGIHVNTSSRRLTAGTVIRTLSKPMSRTGSTPSTSLTSTWCRFRAESHRFSVTSSVTIKTFSSPSPWSLPTNSLVLGREIAKSSTITRRPCRASSDRIEQSAARYILRFT